GGMLASQPVCTLRRIARGGCGRRHLTTIPLSFRLAVALLPCMAAAAVPARAEVPSTAEIARISPSGNYLAARIASQARDMDAAAAYYRGALRADPRNPELVENTFL